VRLECQAVNVGSIKAHRASARSLGYGFRSFTAQCEHEDAREQPEAVACPFAFRAAITCSVSRDRAVPRRADPCGAAGLLL
jgi:hypothetical protein